MKNTILILGLFAALVVTSFWFSKPDFPILTAENRSQAQADSTAFSFVELGEGIIHYRAEGPEQAPTVVLIHGFSTPSFVWEDYFAPLTKAGYRVVSFDNYGRGFSDRPDGNYSADRTDGLLIELLDHLNITRPVHLVGYSMGGATAAVFTQRHPTKVRTLSLIAPAGTGKTSLVQNALALPVLGEIVMATLGPRIVGNATLTAAAESPDPEAFVTSFNVQTSFAGYYDALLSTLRHYPLTGAEPSFQAIGQTNLPVQLIWGEADDRVAFAQAEPMLGLLPQAILHSFPEIGHDITFSQVDLVAPLLLTFIEENRVRQTTGGIGGKARGPDARMEPADCLCHDENVL